MFPHSSDRVEIAAAAPVRILVVEDDPDHRVLLTRALTRHHPPFEVTVASHAEACFSALETSTFNVVLLDYSLPGTDGLAVLATLRRRDVTTPVVMITGQGDERIAVAAMQSGAADYVIKTAGYLATIPTVVYKVLKQHELACENARLHQETQRRLAQSDALLAFARSLGTTIEYGPLLTKIVRAAAQVTETERCSVFLWEAGRVVPVMAQFADGHADEALWETFQTLGELTVDDVGLFVELARQRGPVSVVGAVMESLLPPALRSVGLTALMAVPLERDGKPIGALVFDNFARAGAFTADQVTRATAAAPQVVLALDNARLYRDAQTALAELKEAQDRLVRGETLRALGELASGTAHHLNNLLAVVLARVDLLLTRDPVLPSRDALEIIRRAARDGADVVRRIQEFTRTAQLERCALDLNALAGEVAEMTRGRWQDAAHAQRITIDLALSLGAVPPVLGHAASLREVLTNLIINAVDALPAGGRIGIRTWVDGDMVALAVNDDGIGMSESVLRRAQEPFFTTKGMKSTGLGLAVNYGILQRHGGDLVIDSGEGRGTTVTIRVPQAGVPAQAISKPMPAPEPVGSLAVLVVDDDEDVREALVELIEHCGHVVRDADGGTAALERLEAGEVPDVVVTDFGMPGMTGNELAHEVKRRWPHVKIVLITGWRTDGASPDIHPDRVDFVLAKPVGLSELRDVFTSVGETCAAGGGRRVAVGDDT